MKFSNFKICGYWKHWISLLFETFFLLFFLFLSHLKPNFCDWKQVLYDVNVKRKTHFRPWNVFFPLNDLFIHSFLRVSTKYFISFIQFIYHLFMHNVWTFVFLKILFSVTKTVSVQKSSRYLAGLTAKLKYRITNSWDSKWNYSVFYSSWYDASVKSFQLPFDCTTSWL